MLRFLKEAYKFTLIAWKDNRTKKGGDADIRIATTGFPVGMAGPWFSKLIEERTGQQVVFSWYRPSLLLTSLFGSAWLLKILLSVYNRPSVFFSGENIATLKKYRGYRDYLGDLPSLALGFDYRKNNNYKRLPLWLLYIFSSEFVARASLDDIQERLDEIEERCHQEKPKFTAMIASHEGYCTRRKVIGNSPMVSRAFITRQVESIGYVHCPGKLCHNDDTLKDDFGDDKKEYLQQFRFNICSENTSSPGYVTEKLFESFDAGAIPIYWGDDNPEPTILNHERIVFWLNDSNNAETLERIKKLYLSETEMQKFLAVPIFKQNAAAEIYRYFEILNTGLINLLKQEVENDKK